MKAFPYVIEVPSDKDEYKAFVHEEGMDLRDYFAAKVMQGLLSSNLEASTRTFVAKAYEIADAMMEARK